MGLKQYLRGLGLGVIVASLVLGFGNKETKTMTDEEIKARALELGMTEAVYEGDFENDDSGLLQGASDLTEGDETEDVAESNNTEQGNKDLDSANSDSDEPDTGNADTNEADDANSNSNEANANKTDSSTVDTNNSDTTENEQTETDATGVDATEQYILFTVKSGDSSNSVSARLEELGVVESAKGFDKYLCDYGYDKIIKVGTHEVTVGGDYKTIATQITTKY